VGRFASARRQPRDEFIPPSASTSSVRSLCPFCGSINQPAYAEPCCDQWGDMTDAIVAAPPRIEERPRIEEPPPPPRIAQRPPPLPPVVRRPSRAHQPVVTLVLSSLAAVLVTFGIESYRSRERAKLPPQLPPAPRTGSESIRVAPPSRAIEDPRESAKVKDTLVAVEWTPEFRTKWSHLNRMMSRTAVRALLGEPKWIDTLSSPNFEYWLYKDPTIRGEGWIAFRDNEESVYRWWDSGPLVARDPK
jgi:hypothetical protein